MPEWHLRTLSTFPYKKFSKISNIVYCMSPQYRYHFSGMVKPTRRSGVSRHRSLRCLSTLTFLSARNVIHGYPKDLNLSKNTAFLRNQSNSNFYKVEKIIFFDKI